MDLRYLVFAALAVVLPSLYILTASVASPRLPTLKNKRICLLIAHPDDEAMFFAPTILALTRPDTGNHVKILCLSTGNADGLGNTRKKELVKSGLKLGLRDEDDVFVIDSPTDFPDSMTTVWDRNKISGLLGSAFAPGLDQERTDDAPQPTANIDVLITFDNNGVSSHLNHISLFYGARTFVAGLTQGKPGWKSPIDLYTLSSVNFLRKYTSFLDVLVTLLRSRDATSKDAARPAHLVFLNSLVGSHAYATAWKTMTEAHKSQMVWFRYGWITLSRYMVINDLHLEQFPK
ncbi:N-acetylglucosaminyl-phosphatidylinositol de-N-acetylase [Dactylonectria estremocensis]|uniref:N-acetylglucosaminylphosphatidylinositol deacetylase n=1 Tax=Dactylonectria estremocensis TaxID=1079267 RepID=A0A9P9EUZ1_9HYPO|nr:N-acetylglucosaminyl-phosphatidylinositol de-N-acetylase [Dactylonectria estremocensis]